MKFGDYAPDDAFIDPHTKDEVYVFHFENGYGANIARGPYTYGGPQGLWELAVTKKSRDGWGYDLCYDTPITNDVIGWLDELGVVKVLKKIENLPKIRHTPK